MNLFNTNFYLLFSLKNIYKTSMLLGLGILKAILKYVRSGFIITGKNAFCLTLLLSVSGPPSIVQVSLQLL